MENIKAHIDEQVLFNSGKNLFCDPSLSDFGFSSATIAFVQEHLPTLKNTGTQEEELLLDYLTDKVVVALCQANQFYYFNSFDRTTLRKIYQKLLSNIKALPEHPTEQNLKDLAQKHYRTLQSWLKRSNPFAKSLYAPTELQLTQE